MSAPNILKFTLIAVTMLLLYSCNPINNMSDLEAYVAEVNSREGEPVEPVPEFIPYEGFIYSAASQRSPFDVPLVIQTIDGQEPSQDVQPDFEREKEELELHSFSELTMVGMLQKNSVFHALIEDGVGQIHRISIGDYMGRNFGRVTFISENQINLVEIVPSGNGGWVERPQSLTLQQRRAEL